MFQSMTKLPKELSKVDHKGEALMDAAALELGRITMEWARLEGAVNEAIGLLAPLEEGSVTEVVIGNADMRGKVQMMRGLAFIRKRDDTWFDDVNYVLSIIDNDLRVRRNEFIHAEWFIPKRKLELKTFKTKLKRPQAFMMELETQQNIPITMREMRRLTKDMQTAWFSMLTHIFYVVNVVWETPSDHKPALTYKEYLWAAGLGDPTKELRQAIERQKNQKTNSSSKSKSRNNKDGG
jgi:hypothetical protein